MSPGGFTQVPDKLAVYEDFLDADGKLERFRESGAVEYRFGIEECQVGDGAFAEHAAVFPTDTLGGKRGHFTDGFGQREPMFFADVDAKDAGESAGAARMGRANATVAGDHDPGLLIKGFDVGLDHRFADDLGFGIGGVTFANDADIHLDGRDVVGGGELCEVVIFVGAIWLEFGDGDVLRATIVAQRFVHAGGIFVLLVWHDHFDVGVPCIVGIAIGEEIDAAFARGLDDADIFGCFVPNADGADLDVRVLDGDVGAFTNGDFLVERGEALIAFVANVGHVEAAMRGRDSCFGDDFVGGTVARDVVFEPGGEADGAFIHGLLGELRHFGDFVGCRDAAKILAHDLIADSGVAGHHRNVERGRIGAPRGEIRRDGPWRITVGAEDDGGDALRDLRFGERIGFEAVGGVIVNIDEAGREDEAFGVDDLVAGLGLEICGDGDDAVAGDAQVGFSERRAGAVGDFGVDDEDARALRLSA